MRGARPASTAPSPPCLHTHHASTSIGVEQGDAASPGGCARAGHVGAPARRGTTVPPPRDFPLVACRACGGARDASPSAAAARRPWWLHRRGQLRGELPAAARGVLLHRAASPAVLREEEVCASVHAHLHRDPPRLAKPSAPATHRRRPSGDAPFSTVELEILPSLRAVLSAPQSAIRGSRSNRRSCLSSSSSSSTPGASREGQDARDGRREGPATQRCPRRPPQGLTRRVFRAASRPGESRCLCRTPRGCMLGHRGCSGPASCPEAGLSVPIGRRTRV
ncbi:hypothetical protein T484DRAFT_1950992 [Baffinella frigidus]|nr:hypothetical protein T484DRAFT_1950992 [Cryptophyta sp. CCMP2293]